MNILFWNINKNRDVFPCLCDIVKSEAIDILLLAEFPYLDENEQEKDYKDQLLEQLRSVSGFNFKYNLSIKKRVEVFYNSVTTYMEGIKDEARLSGSKVNSVGGSVKVSLVFFHLPSKVNYDSNEQSEKAEEYRKAIEDYEDVHQQDHLTVVCGDFNMNPFEHGMVKAKGFHSVMEESIANQTVRKIDGNEYKFFYNPMWGFFGDTGKGKVSGTHYFRDSRHILYFWNLYDQVLVRPEALKYFDKDALTILTEKSGCYNLLTVNGIIDKKYSDHLPIKFKLNI